MFRRSCGGSLLDPKVNNSLFSKSEVFINEFHVLSLILISEDLVHLHKDSTFLLHDFRSIDWFWLFK